MENSIDRRMDPERNLPTLLERIDTRLHAFVNIDTAPAVDGCEQDPAGLIVEVDQVLKAGTYGSRLTKSISEHFQQDSKKARGDFFVRISIVATVIYDTFLFADSFVIPDVLWLAIGLQLCIGTPVAIAGIWFVWARRPDPTIPTIVVSAVMMLTTIALFSLSRDPHVFLFSSVFPLYLLATNVALALPFKPALLLTVASIGAFATAIIVHPSLDNTAKVFLIITLISAGHYSLVGNYRIEASFRRTYLYTLKESLRSHILAKANSELACMARVDGLTGIGNRRQFDETIRRIWLEARTNVAILLIDIDFFKTLNDSYGHQAGDLYLSTVAKVLAADLDQIGTLARYGGEEFVAILTDSDSVEALKVAERLRRSVEALAVRFDDVHDIRATISIGCVVCTPSSHLSPSEAVAAADAALYRAKASGRNRTWLLSGNLDIAA